MTTATRTVKFFNKTTLVKTAQLATKRGYNRQLNVKLLKEQLPDDHYFPVSFSMLHEHAAGLRVDPHVRCMIVVNADGDTVMLDVDMDIYNALPQETVEIPDRG